MTSKTVYRSGEKLKSIYLPKKSIPDMILNISSNDIEEIDKAILKHQFDEIDLSNNCIYTLPRWINILSVNSLNLSYNNIEVLYSGIFKNEIIDDLDVSHNFIREVDITSLNHELNELNLSDNYIEKIGNIEYLKELTILDISNNNFTIFGNICKLTNLINLNMSSNPISGINVSNMSSLQTLNLSHCGLDDIPQDIYHLKSLRELNLQCNNITTLDGIGNMDSIKVINLNMNSLKNISSIKSATMTELNLEDNEINYIDWLDVPKCKVNIKNNPLVCISNVNCKDIYGNSLNHIMNYIQRKDTITKKLKGRMLSHVCKLSASRIQRWYRQYYKKEDSDTMIMFKLTVIFSIVYIILNIKFIPIN